jgi:hypothetical protein
LIFSASFIASIAATLDLAARLAANISIAFERGLEVGKFGGSCIGFFPKIPASTSFVFSLTSISEPTNLPAWEGSLPFLAWRRNSRRFLIAPSLPLRFFHCQSPMRKTARIIITPIGTPTEAPIAEPSCFEDGLEGPVVVGLAVAEAVVEGVVDGAAAAATIVVAETCAREIEVEFSASGAIAVLFGSWSGKSCSACRSSWESSLLWIEAASNAPCTGSRRKSRNMDATKL